MHTGIRIKKQSRQKRTYIGPKDASPKGKIKAVDSRLLTKNHGNILLFEKTVETTVPGKILQSCFSADYKELLALACYEIMEASPDYLFHYRLEEQNLGATKSLHSSTVSRLHESLGRDQKGRNQFMNQWISTLAPIRGIYYGITSFSSYSTKIDFVEWGYNRDRETLPQINLGTVCCRERGFFSTSNILSIMDSPGRINILQPLSFSLKKAKELIGLHAKALKSNRTAFKYNEEILHRLTAPVHIGNHNFAAHIFFNEKIDLDKRHRFLSNLLDIESQHKECKFDSQKEAQAFINTEIPEKLRPFFHREKSSNRIVKNGSKMKRPISKLGYFIIITNDNI